MLSWPRVAGWLHTEIDVRHRELNPDTVAHLSTNRARRRLTCMRAIPERFRGVIMTRHYTNPRLPTYLYSRCHH